eukprot:INCI16512.1.p2 GENE.INCI16512.1~~INCI16512.1.p2  ORF type:complete len:206 (+),score=32.10 INCI16512.1:208-825(+)
MSVAAAGRQLLSLAHESHFQPLEDKAIKHVQANIVNDKYIRLQTQDERVQRFKMLSGAGMVKSLHHSGYNPTETDSLSAEMSRQKDITRNLQQRNYVAQQPAGILSGMHNQNAAGDPFAQKGGIRTKPLPAGRDPILAKGNIEVSFGFDVGYKSMKQRIPHRGSERRNIITGEGKMTTHGFDAFRRPMFGGGQLRQRSTLNLYAH